MRSDIKSMLPYVNKPDITGTHEGGKAQHKGLSFSRNERRPYHKGQRAPNKSPDAPVMYVDISLVPFHYTYQQAFLQMSDEWKISRPIAVRLRTDHTEAAAAAAICSLDQYCNNRGSCQPALLNCLISGLQAVELWSYRRQTGPTAIWLQPFSAALPLCLFYSSSPLPSECTETRQAVL